MQAEEAQATAAAAAEAKQEPATPAKEAPSAEAYVACHLIVGHEALGWRGC